MARLGTAVRRAGVAGVSAILLVLMLGLAASWHIALSQRANEQARAEMVLTRNATQAEAAVTNEIHRYLDAIRSMAAAVGAHENLTAGDFKATTAPLLDAGLRGATSIVFVVATDDGGIEQVRRYWSSRGLPELALVPNGTGHEHLFTIYARPLDGNRPIRSGVDVTQAAEPTIALNEARRSGQPTLSDTYVLLRDRDLPPGQRQLSFILTAPVYGVPDPAGQRAFKGWVLFGLHGRDFAGGVLDTATERVVNAELMADDANGRETLVAELHRYRHTDQERTMAVPIANRQWRLRVTAAGSRLAGSTVAVPVAIGGGGTLLTLLVVGMLWALAGGRSRAETKVIEATVELRAAERTAHRQVALLNGILERISDGVGVVDENGAFLVHNPAAKTMLGLNDDIDGAGNWQSHYGIFRPDGITPLPVEELPLVRALAGESTDGVEMLIRNATHPDGVLLSVSGRPLDVDGRHGAIAVFHDITVVRERENDLTAFAGIVAHDLKNPLTVIAAHAEMAQETLRLLDGDLAADAASSVERITGGVLRMRRLIDDLLAYTTARDAALKPQPVDLQSLVTDVVEERVSHLSVRPDIYIGSMPWVLADPAMLRQVLDNLVGNALKYVAPGRAAKIDVSAARTGHGWVKVEVADRGIGVPDADKPRVFDSYHRAHREQAYGGTGLGLAICRRIVDRHGGTIVVADNPGGGSRFRFTVPEAPTTAEAPATTVTHEYV